MPFTLTQAAKVFRVAQRELIHLCKKQVGVLDVRAARGPGSSREFSGKGTRALAEALSAAEQKAASLRAELQAYEASAQSLFEAPPVEWAAERLSSVKQVLEAEPTTSALTLRRVLGPVRPMPVVPQVGRPYCQADTALQVLDLIEAPEDGSTWSGWWRRWASNPRPETLSGRFLHPYPAYFCSRHLALQPAGLPGSQLL